MLRCPQCGSKLLYTDGLRYLADGSSVQRFLCRNCNYRFSESRKPYISTYTKNGSDAHQKAAKLLVEAKKQTEKQEAGATEKTAQQDVKGKILEYLWHLQKMGRSDFTIRDYKQKLEYLTKKTNLLEPEAVKEFLAKANISETSKHNYATVLKGFYDYYGITWKPPEYKVSCKIPFIPTEQELDLLIANSSKTLSALLQLLKETGIRVGEALKLKWTDIDFERRTVRITPEKGRLPKKCERVFPSRNVAQTTFYRRRKRLAFKLGNPRLLKIGLHSFRHWERYHRIPQNQRCNPR